MLPYELVLVLRQMPKPEMVATLKRTAESILDKGGLIQKIENYGTKNLPYKISEHGLVHKIGSYFIMEFRSPPNLISDLREEFGRDIDIIRKQIYRVEPESEVKCTLHEELLPPAYRKEVQQMIKIGQKKQKPKYNYNSGLDYYPFQK